MDHDGKRTPLRVTVWGENVHERGTTRCARSIPDGMHAAIAAGLAELLGDARPRAHRDAARSPSTA